jgi:pyoverdine/dityrosine biosynthesis protein Dit1
MKLNKCRVTKSGKFIISNEENSNWHLIAYNEQLSSMIKDVDGATIVDKLFNAGELTLFYNQNNVVTQVKTI